MTTFNSNTINLGIGVLVPGLFTSFGALAVTGKLRLAWLIAMTVACIALLAMRGGMRRSGAGLLILLRRVRRLTGAFVLTPRRIRITEVVAIESRGRGGFHQTSSCLQDRNPGFRVPAKPSLAQRGRRSSRSVRCCAC